MLLMKKKKPPKKKKKLTPHQEMLELAKKYDLKVMAKNRKALIGLFDGDPRTLAEIRREIWQ